MPVLNIGVMDVAYTDDNGATTTYEVAEILEARYGVFTAFYEAYKDKIAALLADDMADQIKRMVSGGGSSDHLGTLTYGADQKIEAMFRRFILTEEHGIIVAASQQQGSRFKSPGKKGNGKPAFVDTGLLLESFRTWTLANRGSS